MELRLVRQVFSTAIDSIYRFGHSHQLIDSHLYYLVSRLKKKWMLVIRIEVAVNIVDAR